MLTLMDDPMPPRERYVRVWNYGRRGRRVERGWRQNADRPEEVIPENEVCACEKTRVLKVFFPLQVHVTYDIFAESQSPGLWMLKKEKGKPLLHYVRVI